MSLKLFGEKVKNIEYIPRPGAYGIALNAAGEVMIIEIPNGFHLPGGGIEADESEIECLKREFIEETGYEITILEKIGEAKQLTQSMKSMNYYELYGNFYRVELGEKVAEPIEDDHTVVFLSPQRAIACLSLEYQAEMVKRATEN